MTLHNNFWWPSLILDGKRLLLVANNIGAPSPLPWKFRLKNSDNVSRVICPKPVKSLVRRFFSVYWMEMFFLFLYRTRQMHFELSVQLLKLNGTLDWGYLVWTLSSKHYALSFVGSISFLWQKSNAVFPPTGCLVLGFWSKEPLELTRYRPDASQPAFVVNSLLHLQRRIYFGSFRP